MSLVQLMHILAQKYLRSHYFFTSFVVWKCIGNKIIDFCKETGQQYGFCIWAGICDLARKKKEKKKKKTNIDQKKPCRFLKCGQNRIDSCV